MAGDTFRRVHFDLARGRMAGIAWGDATRAPDILFIHATGMNAMTYRSVLQPLGERFHVLAIDVRGHGLTELPAKRWGYSSWNRHRDDVIELIETYLKAPLTLAGHSMGATVSLLIAGKRPHLARALAMIDPVIMPPGRYQTLDLPFAPTLMMSATPIVRGARRRRATFESKDAAFEALKGRGFFKTFPEQTLRDYIEDGFVDDGQGGVRLACSPAYEAATFSAQRNNPWAALMRAPKSLVVLRAETNSTISVACANRIKSQRPEARIATIAGSTHALPMERPDRARAAIETAHVMATGGAAYVDLE
ncbi:MAG: alpha/beta fold hydrolase [Hyphomonadaceae bacterium]